MLKTKKLGDFEKAEHARITEEILKDRELQFKLFWQSIAVTVAVFSLCVNLFHEEYWIRFPFMILAPHLILIPTATIILNRARTANRKSGYLLVAFSQYSDSINWEKHLSVLRNHSGNPPHRAATIRSMLISITFLEIVALIIYLITLFVGTLRESPDLSFITWVLIIAGLVYMGFYGYFLVSRYQSYFCTKYATSIQGYATKWAQALHLHNKALRTGDEWSHENWLSALKQERERYWILSLLWWFICKDPANISEKWKFEKSVLKPVLLSMGLYLAIAGFSYHSIRNLPSVEQKRLSEKDLTPQSKSKTTDKQQKASGLENSTKKIIMNESRRNKRADERQTETDSPKVMTEKEY